MSWWVALILLVLVLAVFGASIVKALPAGPVKEVVRDITNLVTPVPAAEDSFPSVGVLGMEAL